MPSLIDTVSQELSKEVVKNIIGTIQRLTWKMEAATECESGNQSATIHSIIFTPDRRSQLEWAMLPEPSCGNSRHSGLRSSFQLSVPYSPSEGSENGGQSPKPTLIDHLNAQHFDFSAQANTAIDAGNSPTNHLDHNIHDDDNEILHKDQQPSLQRTRHRDSTGDQDITNQGKDQDIPSNRRASKKITVDLREKLTIKTDSIDSKATETHLALDHDKSDGQPPISPLYHPRIPSIILMKQSSSLDVVQSVSGNGKISTDLNVNPDDIDDNNLATYIHNRTCSFDSVHSNHVLTLARDSTVGKMTDHHKTHGRKIDREQYLCLRPLSDVRSSAVMTQEDLTDLGLKTDLLGQLDSQSMDKEMDKAVTTLDINTSDVFRQSCADMVQLFSSRNQLQRIGDSSELLPIKRMSYHASQELIIPLIIPKDSTQSHKQEDQQLSPPPIPVPITKDKVEKKESSSSSVDQQSPSESRKQLSVSLSDNTEKLIASISQIHESLQVLNQGNYQS